ncbi:hypothetical protein GOB46_09040 [Sinorhizobium meliloti]|uniref:hypothetical protein n=1 Tax=Rhizobium meliloti TaxID=382 RepID=UPI00299EB57F|nr:hypothetical protein [Sinorhizobium meliloti]MDW9870923.1 hypothetical protein [Sinorhizobium meliloti]MDW9883904.1 hypothetical protein [Sinorhizobium meliloti]MDX0205784.1 hypothetical protein [Sinorhizobium meliloti]
MLTTGNKKGRGETAPTFLIIAYQTNAGTSVVKSRKHDAAIASGELVSAHKQCR